MKLIAITGGIGSGKSVVCRVLSVMGYPVYDCDLRARELMDTDALIRRRIASEIAEEALLPDGSIDRGRLVSIVFADKAMLDVLNSIVHRSVREDIENWAGAQTSDVAFVETAIPNSSGLWSQVDGLWRVYAPVETRIARVMQRNGATRSEVEARIASQSYEEQDLGPTVRIVNDGVVPVMPQILANLSSIK